MSNKNNSQTKPAVPAAPPAENKEQNPPDGAAENTGTGTGSPNGPEQPQPLVKSDFAKVKITDFRGTYKTAFFDDDGICGKIDQQTLEELSVDFPGVKIESYEIAD